MSHIDKAKKNIDLYLNSAETNNKNFFNSNVKSTGIN